MKNAPFNITTVLFAVLAVSIIAGGICAVILKAMGITGFWGIFLAAFLPVPLASLVRQAPSIRISTGLYAAISWEVVTEQPVRYRRSRDRPVAIGTVSRA